MRWAVVIFYGITASVTQATIPIDLQSPFLKTVIYQKKIAGYGAGPIEQKEVAQGLKKDSLYEFRKADGTLFLVSESEVMGVLPVFPTVQTPCEKGDVEAAIRFLEQVRGNFPNQPEASEAVLEKWKSLALVFGEIEKEWQVSPRSLDQSVKNLFLGWTGGLLAVLFLGLALGLVLLRKRVVLALGLILVGLGGGSLLWASLQLPAHSQEPQEPSHGDDCSRILWAISCAKKAGLIEARTEFRVPIDAWMNFLFQRIRFPEVTSSGLQPALSKPFFRKTTDGVLIEQPVQVGPFVFPLAIELFELEGKESPDQGLIKKVWLGRVPWPVKLAETWVGRIFEGYRFLWNELSSGGSIKWKMGSHGELEIQVMPKAT